MNAIEQNYPVVVFAFINRFRNLLDFFYQYSFHDLFKFSVTKLPHFTVSKCAEFIFT